MARNNAKPAAKAATRPKSRLEQVMNQIRAKAAGPSEPGDGGIAEAFLKYLPGREPRDEFFSMCDIIKVNLEMFGDKEFRKRFKKVSGFETQVSGIQKLLDLYSLIAALSHWKVDRYLQLHRFDKGFKATYSEAEIDALEEMYVKEHGKNDDPVLIRDEIRSASFCAEQREKRPVTEPLEELPF